jgi:hypothetical protein
MKKKILIPIYHIRDYNFYKIIANKLKNHSFFFLIFFDLRIKNLEKNCQIVNFFDLNLTNFKNIYIDKKKLVHESLSFNLDIKYLKNKYSIYFCKIKELLKKLKVDFVIHELGGFVCHLAMFNACIKLKINHYFIEPTPLKKNCFFLKNSMFQENAIKVNNTGDTKKKINEYYKCIKNKKYLSINNKDLHLFKNNMFNQIIAITTIKAFLRKVSNFFLFRRTEFNNLFAHFRDYMNRIKNSFINFFVKKVELKKIEDFIYYPLHVPLDFALTYRALEKLDQIKNLKKIFPKSNYKLILKEHPLIYSRYNYFSIIKKLEGIDVSFFKKDLSSLEVSSKAACILTINSKSGLEFLCKDKPVFSLSRNYYTKPGLAKYICKRSQFSDYLNDINKYKPNKSKVHQLLFWLFEKAVFFDLYNVDLRNSNKSAKTLKSLINENKIN